MSTIRQVTVNFPINTSLDNFTFYYRALFEAHQIPNCIPAHNNSEYDKIHNGISENQLQLERDFIMVDKLLYQFKNDHGFVELKDMKIMGRQAFLKFKLGK